MKKTLIIALSLLISSYTFCQTPSSFDREEVVEVKNTKAKLYANAQTWIAKTFGSYNAVVQFEDKNQGRILLKAKSNINFANTFKDVKYTIIIDVKDNKYKYSIEDVEIGIGSAKTATTYHTVGGRLLYREFLISQKNKLLDEKASGKGGADIQDKIDNSTLYYQIEERGYELISTKLIDLTNSLKIDMKKNDDF